MHHSHLSRSLFLFSQVCSVLDSLEREYKRDDDWLSSSSARSPSEAQQQREDKVALVLQLINKHQEQKEAFLKACTLARRTAETFLKYSNRSLQYFSPQQVQQQESTFRGPESKVKGSMSVFNRSWGCHVT